jgi:hypothetical protein
VLGPRKEILILILALSLFAAAQPPDYHVTADPSHSAYCRSAFLHGHRHGYEDGYHAADQDFHIGRPPQILNPKFHVPKIMGYQSEYGSKASFKQGYSAGFIAGYSDSYAGRQFSHPGEHVAAATAKSPVELPQSASTFAIDAAFDSGVYEGYRSALADKATFELQPGLAQYAEDFCRHNLIRGSGSGFCSGYGSGFVLGKADTARRMRPEPDNVVRIANNQR